MNTTYPCPSPAAASSEETLIRRAEAALPAALRACCKAEAQRMWKEMSERFCASPDRKDAFVEDMTQNLLKKISLREKNDLRNVLLVQFRLGQPGEGIC